MHDYKLQLNLSANQANLLQKALDLYIRVGIGQLEAVAEVVNELHDVGDSQNYSRELFVEIKKEILDLPRNGNHGITNDKVSKNTKTSFDLLKAIEKGIATAEEHGGHSVWHDGDILHLGQEPTPTVVIVRDGVETSVEVKKHWQ